MHPLNINPHSAQGSSPTSKPAENSGDVIGNRSDTSPRFRCGLVVGKFSPLHLGHEWLIETAQRACENVVIIGYSDPEYAGCGWVLRERWLARRFPTATRLVFDATRLAVLAREQGLHEWPALPANAAPDATHRAFCGWLCKVLLKVEVDAVFTSEDYGEGFAAALSAMYAKPGQSAPAVAHVSVDRARHAVPISATRLRAEPAAGRLLMAPDVYAEWLAALSP